MKLKTTTKILIGVFIVGLSLLCYPSFSNYWNEKHATAAITSFVKSLDEVNEEKYHTMWEEAIEYNKELLDRPSPYVLPSELSNRYRTMLNLDPSGVMGYIEIKKLNVMLPVYHGTSERVLASGTGHLEWTSLPVGGVGTHTSLSGHRGLPSAKLFTDLDRLREGDIFDLVILNNVLSYEVDQIRTVTPTEVDDLLIDPEMDYCTLVTCTPYGINSHRLLVRGHRVTNESAANVRVISEAVLIDSVVVASFLAAPLILILILMVMLKKPEKKINVSDLLKMQGE